MERLTFEISISLISVAQETRANASRRNKIPCFPFLFFIALMTSLKKGHFLGDAFIVYQIAAVFSIV